MEIFEYFIIPGTIFSVGVVIWFLLGVSPQKLELSKGEIQIGTIDKQVLIDFSPEQRKAIKKLFFWQRSYAVSLHLNKEPLNGTRLNIGCFVIFQKTGRGSRSLM